MPVPVLQTFAFVRLYLCLCYCIYKNIRHSLTKRVSFCLIKIGVCNQKLLTLEFNFHYWLSSHYLYLPNAFFSENSPLRSKKPNQQIHFRLRGSMPFHVRCMPIFAWVLINAICMVAVIKLGAYISILYSWVLILCGCLYPEFTVHR